MQDISLRDQLRSFPVKPYIVFYIKLDDGIEIVRILHESRDIDRRGRGAPGAPLAGGKDSGFPCVQRFLANPFMDGEQQKCPLYPRSARNTTSLLQAPEFI